jgi:glycosyltransferase involved in cell wall biosynthesis
MYRSNLLAGLSGRVAGKPVVWNIRCSSLEPLRFSSRAVARLGGVLARWVPRFVINCSSQSVSIHDRLGYGAAEGAVIPNGYDPEVLTMDEKARSRTRRALGLRGGAFVIGTVGRWHVQKGIPLLLQAVRLLRERGIPVRLVLAGRGLDSENPELAKIIQESGCSDQVERLGQRRDIPDIARALDLHVLASIGSEGFPNVVAETMLAGTPNVATDVGDAAHIVGDTGWVVGPGQADALADAIGAAHEEWASSPAQWQRRRKAARQRIVDNFSLESMATAYEKVWRQVVRSAA